MTADEKILARALEQDDELQMAELLRTVEEDSKAGESAVLDNFLAQCRSMQKKMKAD